MYEQPRKTTREVRRHSFTTPKGQGVNIKDHSEMTTVWHGILAKRSLWNPISKLVEECRADYERIRMAEIEKRMAQGLNPCTLQVVSFLDAKRFIEYIR